MKKQNGITLIALVISIIVMLILAGVSINAIVGENGVLTKAQNAKALHEAAAMKEQLEMAKADMVMNSNMSESEMYWLEVKDVSTIVGLDSIPDDLKEKLEIQEGNLVYNPELCEEGEIEYFKSMEIPEGDFTIQGIQVNIQGAEEASTLIGPNIAIGLDLSGSMDYDVPPRLTYAREAIQNIIENSFLETEDTRTALSVVTWNNPGDVEEKYVDGRYCRIGAGILQFGNNLNFATTYQEAQQLKQKVGTLDTISGKGWNTHMENGLSKTYQSLSLMQEKYNDNVPFIIFLADGEATDDEEKIYEKAQEIRDAGVTIYTIGYAVANDSKAHRILKTIAGDDEQCVLADSGDATKIIEAFEKIKKKIDNITTGINTDRGILTLEIQEGCKIDDSYPITVTILNNTYTYTTTTLPSNMVYDYDNCTLKWNIRQYTEEEQNNLNIDFKITPK